MADPKVLAWGVLCGSGERAGEPHGVFRGKFEVLVLEESADQFAEFLDGYDGQRQKRENCGPHSVVPLWVVERAE